MLKQVFKAWNYKKLLFIIPCSKGLLSRVFANVKINFLYPLKNPVVFVQKALKLSK